ncbi:DNA replication initiation factor CDC45 KNAG_0G02220 [Huiozyma naganishii CBS 8797]|uniref:Cell division control protein 45 n=1 Tax=Huiozyma naganishii (strain ATCC MYA-139 / BCRC 22969 / CBS 8797 / KCTC 17520 / NBRC 10181 / NCYC 3082 / Yp74L-3) TaxID=1071383 RepID=J7R8T3_HUIN7|nr:hypothetical protein KNAG_0G02220 [Kazachstania naganishii CBS 8797]CCK71280.1 hypothetical protein KNAG_0G02220 [Kazachstania naganishii CBS 8797]
MYYGIPQYTEAYNKIVKSSSSPSSCRLVIFVSCLNIDALCATKMLSNIFKKQLVQTQIMPVFGYSELKLHYDKLDETINSVILVGFGGFIDLETFLDIDSDQLLIDEEKHLYSRDIYVFDGHRPWNLDNLFGSDIVHCLDDGTVEENLQEEKNAYLKLLQIENEREQDDDDEDLSDSSDGEDDEEGGAQTDRDDGQDDEDSEDEFMNNNNKRQKNDEDTEPSRKMLIKQRKKEMHECEKVLETYYTQGTTIVNSISSQVYSLLSGIGETNLQNLWLTILGVTSLDTMYTSVYSRLSPILQDEVKRLSPKNGQLALRTPDSFHIDLQPDYYLFLLRHTSLYDGFYYSNYVNAKLSIWNENGKKRLHKMFARMGIPLITAQESYLYMDNSIKRELKLIFDKNLNRYGLQDIVKDGFIKTFGYRGVISASEMVEALTALLEVGTHLSVDERGNIFHENTDKTDHISVKSRWVSNFWLSFDALDEHKTDVLKCGLRHATLLQKAIFNTGVAILEKRLIKHLRIYRLCVLQDGPDIALYQNPLTLLRLGNWLIECCSEAEDKQLLPMVLASINEATDTYLVAGLSPRYPRGLDTIHTKAPILNNFSMAFQQITKQTGAHVKIDNFESSIIEIRREDLSPFLEKLTLSGLI